MYRDLEKNYLEKIGIKAVDPAGTWVKYRNKLILEKDFYKNNSGYLFIQVYDPKTKHNKILLIHRLNYLFNNLNNIKVLKVGEDIHHKNHNRTDNKINNLELLSREENLARDRKPATYMPHYAKKKQYTYEYLYNKIKQYQEQIEFFRQLKKDNYKNKNLRKYYDELIHKKRSNVAQWKLRLKMFEGKI